MVKNPPSMQGMLKMRVQLLVWEDPPEEEMATRSCVLAWRIPLTEEPGRLLSTDSQERQA